MWETCVCHTWIFETVNPKRVVYFTRFYLFFVHMLLGYYLCIALQIRCLYAEILNKNYNGTVCRRHRASTRLLFTVTRSQNGFQKGTGLSNFLLPGL